MSSTTDTTPRSIGTYLVPLRKNYGWILGAGIALVVMGVVGLAMVVLLSITTALTFGALMLFGGALLLADAFRREGWKSRLQAVAIGILYVVTGLLVFYNPLSAMVALTVLVACALIAIGVLRIVVAFHLRPNAAWLWMLLAGVLAVGLGLLILAQWPASSAWVLGVFLAVELISQGWAYIMLALAVRSTMDGVKAPPAAA